MFIRRFQVRNYMVHQHTTIDLHPLTVLVGPNGAGKSALFDAMLNFSLLARGNLRLAFGSYPHSFRAKLYRGANALSRIGFEVVMSRTEHDPDSLTYSIDYAQQGMAEDQPTFMIFNERLARPATNAVIFDRNDPTAFPISRHLRLDHDRSLFSALRLHGSTAGEKAPDPLLDYLTQQISRFNKFRVDATVLGAPSRLPELGGDGEPVSQPRIGYHGEDLAAVLYYLAETQSPALEEVRGTFREIEPAFEDFEFNSVGTDRIAFAVRYADQRHVVPSVNLSSGTLSFIGLIVLVATSHRPPVLMIEEPENGLTPQAIKAFYKAVRKLAVSDDLKLRSQFLISSHSPFVICEAWNGEDRDFIHQVKVAEGRAQVRGFGDVVHDLGIPLGKDAAGNRTHLSLNNAESIMSGYLS